MRSEITVDSLKAKSQDTLITSTSHSNHYKIPSYRNDNFRLNIETYQSIFTGYNPEKPSFLVSHYNNNKNSNNINNLFFQYQAGVKDTSMQNNWRVSCAISVGDFVTRNQSSEPSIGKYVQELYYGQRFGEIWVDYGVLPSHIGIETAIGSDAINLTRSIQADNSPYYEMGARITYEPNNSPWYAAILILKGWQRIATHSKRKAFGHQLKYTNNHFLFNSSSYLGVSPVGDNVNRYFHNLFVQYTVSYNFKVITGVDFGCDHYLDLKKINYYWAPICQLQYKLSDDFTGAGRYEFFYDPNLVLGNLELSKVHGFSFNLDYNYNTDFIIRAEFRQFNLKPDFYFDQRYKLNSFFTLSFIKDIQK